MSEVEHCANEVSNSHWTVDLYSWRAYWSFRVGIRVRVCATNSENITKECDDAHGVIRYIANA